ncbi:hypothetical protein Hanom_Chr13g01229921 [Helianthus anomalus]
MNIQTKKFIKKVKKKSQQLRVLLLRFYLHMGTREGGCSQGFLCLVHYFTPRDTQNERCLVRCGSHRCYPVPILPSTMYSFTWVKKIKFYNLLLIAKILTMYIQICGFNIPL